VEAEPESWPGIGVVDKTAVALILLTAIGLHLLSMNVLYPKIVGKRFAPKSAGGDSLFACWAWIWGAMGLILAVPHWELPRSSATTSIRCEGSEPGWAIESRKKMSTVRRYMYIPPDRPPRPGRGNSGGPCLISFQSYEAAFAEDCMSIWTILFVVLLIAWLGGFTVFHVAGGLIHLLLVFAVISLILHFVLGARTV